MKRNRILSIDWDYFFPDSQCYDWSHCEKDVYLNVIWNFRVNDININTKKPAFDEYIPTIPANFWDICDNTKELLIAESHASILSIPYIENSIITNIDAHHDRGYGKDKEINCGNWGLTKKIKKYCLYYPLWRNTNDEGGWDRKPDQINYGLPAPAEYDCIFICRSGCWTPPWYDNKFRQWIDESKFDITYIDDCVCKDRELNMEKVMEQKIKYGNITKHLTRT